MGDFLKDKNVKEDAISLLLSILMTGVTTFLLIVLPFKITIEAAILVMIYLFIEAMIDMIKKGSYRK